MNNHLCSVSSAKSAKRLLNSNKDSRYPLFALGEILPVVIGWPDTLWDFKDQEDKANQFTINYIWPFSVGNFDSANRGNPANERAWRDIKFRNIVLTRSVMLRSLCSGKSRQEVEKALKDIIRMSR